MKLSRQNFIIFSSVDWATHWQLHHQLTMSLASTGNKVLFVENTGIRSANINDFGRLSDRIYNWKKGVYGFSNIDNNKIISYSPLLLPFPYSRISLFFNKIIFNASISKWIKVTKFDSPIVISFLPTPLIQSAIKDIDPKLTIYYCANNMAASSLSASKVKAYEDYFFGSVDIVFTAAFAIQHYAEKFSDKVFYFPPGIDFDKFELALENDKDIPSDINKIKKPIIGFIGGLGKAIDEKLLYTLSDQCSSFTIVLIGPKYLNFDTLKSKSNIVFLGEKEHSQLPYYIKEFAVGIVPYLCNDFTEGVYPSKLNEYLAMGVPAVSTNLREVRESKQKYKDSIIIADNDNEFIKAVKLLVLENNNDSYKEQRINIAKENSWDSRFNRISEIIKKELIIAKNKQPIINWKSHINAYFNSQLKRIKIVLGVIFSFLIIIYSPLMLIMGEYLIVRDSPKNTDAIVVFSGDGEVSYQNLSYQNRALDAVSFFKEGYANKVFLSSGREQTISDVEIMRLYLVSKGVPNDSIYILQEYPNSTYKNIIMVKKNLDKENIKSILFLTAPYHSRRSELIWEKNAPDIEIITPNLPGILFTDIHWDIDLDKVRVILYEYMAIVYNWIIGRI